MSALWALVAVVGAALLGLFFRKRRLPPGPDPTPVSVVPEDTVLKEKVVDTVIKAAETRAKAEAVAEKDIQEIKAAAASPDESERLKSLADRLNKL